MIMYIGLLSVIIFLFICIVMTKQRVINIADESSQLINESYKDAGKHKLLYKVTYKLVSDYLDGNRISDYLKDLGYKNIAIYGVGDLGTLLLKIFCLEGVEVSFCIDRDSSKTLEKISIITPYDTIPKVDVIIVTALESFEEIKKELKKKTDSKIISLETIIFNI